MASRLPKPLSAVLKIAVSLTLIYFIFTKLDIAEVGRTLRNANPVFLVMALFLFAVSKLLNAFRLNLYFKAIQVKLGHLANAKLYLLGMFYNLFLPGGIGGDAYKGYVIQKKFAVGTKRVISVLLLDRLNGMLLICSYGCLLGFVMDAAVFEGYRWIFLAAIPIGFLVFWIMVQRFFSYTQSVFWQTTGYSALLQALQLGAIWFILLALGIETGVLSYLFVFLVSSIVSVIPLTIGGGIGSRELTFLYGSLWLGLDEDLSVAVSLTFFVMTVLVSFFGIYYHFRKHELDLV